MLERIRQFVPKGTHFNAQKWIFTLPNKSRIHVQTQEAGREKLQGAGIIKAWVDEEWPGRIGEQNFSEILARKTPVYPLKILYTFTPLNGISWGWHRLMDSKSDRLFKGIERFGFSLHDLSISHGGFWTDEAIESFKSQYAPEERDVRVYGKFSAIEGRQYYSQSVIDEAKKRCEPGKQYKIGIASGHIPKLEEDAAGELSIFRPPAKDHRYVIGIDAGGGIRRDYSVSSVWDRDDLCCVAQFRSNKTPPEVFASHVCVGLGRKSVV